MSTRRTQQHKHQRDTARAKEISDLKRENKHLKRQIAQLRRMIEKLQGHTGELETSPDPVSEEVLEKEADAALCPNCKHKVIEIKTPTKTIIGCPNCKWNSNKG